MGDFFLLFYSINNLIMYSFLPATVQFFKVLIIFLLFICETTGEWILLLPIYGFIPGRIFFVANDFLVV